MKNVCIVGYGAIGVIHAMVIDKLEGARLYAVCDIKADKISECKEKYDILGYENFDEMLLDENIESVHICTPHYLHFSMIKKALEAGKSIVCEKPVTMTQMEFDELLSLKNSDKICVVLQNRLNPCIVKLKELVQSEKFGNIKGARGIVTWHRDMDYYNQDKWRGKWATEGGGVLINQAVHTLDFFNYIVGEVAEVRADMINFSLDEIEVEDTCTAYLKFKSGVKGIFFATNAYEGNPSPEFEVIFEKAVVKYSGGKLFVNDELIEEDLNTALGKAYWGMGHEMLFKNYYEENKFFSPQNIKNTMDTMFAIYKSADNNGKEIKLEE